MLPYRRLLLVLLLLGVFLRVWQYGANISFWGDEAFLVHNLQARDGAALLGGLDLGQTAPPAFLIGTDLLGQAMGITEFSTRLIPLLAGCTALLLFAWLARRTLTPLPAAIAIGMFALSGKLIEHSAEFKQYSSDVLVTVVLFCIAAVGWERTALRRLAILCVATAPLLWLSEASVFVFAGLSLALAAQIDIRRPARLLGYIGLNLIPVASFAVLYALSIRHQQYSGLYEFWHKQLFDYAKWYLYPIWLIKGLYLVANYAMPPLGPAVLGFAIAGVIGLWRVGHRPLAWMLVAPILIVVAAASARAYPMGGRVTLFLAPSVILLSACGLDAALQQRHVLMRRMSQVAMAAILLTAMAGDLWAVYSPRCVSHIRPAVRYLQAHRLPGEPIYMIGPDTPNVVHAYWPDMPQPCIWQESLTAAPTDTVFWLLFEFAPEQWQRKRKPSLDVCTKAADVVDSFQLPGGWAVKYRRRTAPQP